jgi:dolichol-phosphate mannosyltransferase
MAVTPTDAPPLLSVVVPFHDEDGNVAPLLAEIAAAAGPIGSFEIVAVDDGSADGTFARLLESQASHPELRVLRHRANAGQSAAIRTGVLAARAATVATLDGDGQNDPADLPRLWQALRGPGAAPGLGMAVGHRVRRNDTWLRRLSSRVANGVRSRFLGDGTPDTGCGLKVFDRAAYVAIPFFDHNHRFLPALFQREGAGVVSVPVGHRARRHGRSHYGMLDRLWVGLGDLAGTAWLRRRFRPAVAEEIHRRTRERTP